MDEVRKKGSNSDTLLKLGVELQQLIDTFRAAVVLNYDAIHEIKSLITLQLNKIVFPELQEFFQSFEQINLSGLSETFNQRLKLWERFLGKFDEDLWATDEDILDYLWDNEGDIDLIKTFSMEKYVESNLGDYLNFFDNNVTFARYSGIIHDAYSAFKQEKYALAIFPLMAATDSIIQLTFDDYTIKDPESKSTKIKNGKNKTYYKALDYVQTTEYKLAISLILFRRIFNVYEKINDPSWNQEPVIINRNWVMHGSYNYDKITKTDVLKMFQLLKALAVVNELSFD